MTIVEELRQNRESGAKRLIAEYKAGLMTLARRFSHDPGDAEELVNRTFAAVVNGIDDYLEQSAFFGWMCQILINIHNKDTRNKANGIIVYPGVVPEVVDESAEEAIFRDIDRSFLHDAVDSLPEDQRESIVMHYFLDIPIPKMAKILAVPAGTVKSRLHYARKALAAKLGAKTAEVAKKPGVKATLLALALCALTAAGAAVTATVHGGAQDKGGLRSERAAAILGSGGVAPRVTAIGETGGTGETSGYSTVAPISSPVAPDSPVAPVPDVPFVPDVPSTTFSSGEQTMNTATTLRTIAASAAFAVATGAPLAASADDYVVNVPLGETLTIDTALVTDIGTKNLVKTGRGVLISSTDMADYTGTITVREGAFEVTTSSDLGTSDGGTVVEDGGTLLVNLPTKDQRFNSEIFTIAGTGDAAYGAAIYQPNRGGNDQNKLFTYIVLSDDATIFAGTHLGLASGSLSMDGHTLTVKGNGNFTFRHTKTPTTVGNLISEIATLRFRGGSNYTGNPSATLMVRNGSTLVLGYNGDNAPPIWWNLVVEEGGKVESEASQGRTYSGDVEWNSTVTDGVSGSLTFEGNVTGTGTIKASAATLTFAKPLGAGVGLDLSGTATAALAPATAYPYEHKGLLTGYRKDGWPAGFDSDRSDTRWSYCPFGPGPQIDRSFWSDSNGQKEVWCSRGYLWNREATNITVKFFIGNVYQSWVYLDGTCVYDNKRDTWVASSEFEIPAGTCRRFEVRTSDGGASNYGGPRNDNDKFQINGVIANDPRGYYFTTNAISTLETPALPTLALADDGALDANGMAMSVAALSGGGMVTNVTTLTVSDTWTLAAADVVAGDALTVHGDLAFGNGCAFDVTGLSNLELGGIYTVCTADAITGFAATEITDGHYKCELVQTGNRIDLVSIPKAMVLGFR